MTTFSAAILLFFVMDPIGNIPLFLSALKHVEPNRRLAVVARDLFIADGLVSAVQMFLDGFSHVLQRTAE